MIGLMFSDLSTIPMLSMMLTFWSPSARVVMTVTTAKASTGLQKPSRVRRTMTAATRGLSRIRHPSLTMPGAGGLQSMMHHAQGGLPEAKLHVGDGGSQSRSFHLHAIGKTIMPASMAASRFEAAEFALSYLPDVVRRACENFEKFHRLDRGVACAEMIDAQSSPKVPGWATAQVAD